VHQNEKRKYYDDLHVGLRVFIEERNENVPFVRGKGRRREGVFAFGCGHDDVW